MIYPTFHRQPFSLVSGVLIDDKDKKYAARVVRDTHPNERGKYSYYLMLFALGIDENHHVVTMYVGDLETINMYEPDEFEYVYKLAAKLAAFYDKNQAAE